MAISAVQTHCRGGFTLLQAALTVGVVSGGGFCREQLSFQSESHKGNCEHIKPTEPYRCVLVANLNKSAVTVGWVFLLQATYCRGGFAET